MRVDVDHFGNILLTTSLRCMFTAGATVID